MMGWPAAASAIAAGASAIASSTGAAPPSRSAQPKASRVGRMCLCLLRGTRQHTGLEPVADFEEAQRLALDGVPQSVLPEQRRIRGARLQGAQVGGERGELP